MSQTAGVKAQIKIILVDIGCGLNFLKTQP